MVNNWLSSMLAAVCLGSFVLLSPGMAYADGENDMSADEIEAKEKAEKSKFVQIYKDESYTYYLDKQNMKWMNIPYQENRMLDVWIKLEPIVHAFDRVDAASSSYTEETSTYYLEHYYIRKDKRQIQFMCELEVNGRPNNDVHTGTYDPRKWEDLVPESIEDHIYHGVMDVVDSGLFSSSSTGGGDFLEDVFRISL